PFDVVVDEQTNNSLLHAMVQCGKLDIIQCMLSKIDLCPRSLTLNNAAGDTPLHYAIKCKIPREHFTILVNAIKANGYDGDVVNHAHFSPFYLALQQVQF